jgi:hypothetical protein
MFRRLVLGTLPLAVLLAGAARPAEDEKLDNKAVGVLKLVGEPFKGARTIHVESKVAFTRTDDKGKRVTNSESTTDAQQPNHFSFRSRRVGEDGGVCMVCDGKNLFAATRVMKEYTQTPAPDDLFKMGQSLTVLGLMNTGMLLLDVFSEDPCESLMNGVNTCSYAGKEKVGDAEAHHVKCTQDGFEWEVWVAAEGKPLLLKVHAAGSAGGGATFDLVQTFHNWKFGGAPPKDVFTYTPPPDARKVQNLDGSRDRK